jgi:uncharacterized membrane-anchored protein YitT (DUF2179 family)
MAALLGDCFLAWFWHRAKGKHVGATLFYISVAILFWGCFCFNDGNEGELAGSNAGASSTDLRRDNPQP